jgi:hypothetical protein
MHRLVEEHTTIAYCIPSGMHPKIKQIHKYGKYIYPNPHSCRFCGSKSDVADFYQAIFPTGIILREQSLIPYKAPVSWWLFAVALGMTVAISLCTLLHQTYRAGSENPADVISN